MVKRAWLMRETPCLPPGQTRKRLSPQGDPTLGEKPQDADSPKTLAPAAWPTSQLGFPELVASWTGTREQCVRKQGHPRPGRGS